MNRLKNVTKGEMDPSVVAQPDKTVNRTEELQSEYSETISVATVSDTDEELLEIERHDYPPGVEGKEQAYRDIEKVFDELEDDKLLDSYTRWKPKEDPPEAPKKMPTKFVPKRPLALPRKLPSAPSHELVAEKRSSKTVRAGGDLVPEGQPEKVKVATESTWKKTSNPAVNIPSRGSRQKLSNNNVLSPRKSIVAELIMQANDEEARRKKLEEERLAKEQTDNLAKLRSGIDSAGTQSEDRPQTQSSGITEFDETDSEANEDSRPSTRGDSRPTSKGESAILLTEVQKYPAGTFLNEKQRLCKDEYLRKGQAEMRRDLKTLQNLSPLVTNEEELSTVKTGPKGTTITTVGHKTQYELKVAASNAIDEPIARQLTRQEELILELAESADGKKAKRDNAPFLESSSSRAGGRKRDEVDKTMFKIVYKEPKWPHQITLDKMVDRLFRVKHLILDDSQLKSLRDITSLLPSLIILSVKSCGLKTLDGTLAFPNLQKLFASDNQLTHATQCSLLTELQELDLSGNPIDSLDGFRYLGVLNFLRVMKLYDTKVSEIRFFHMELRRLIPTLRDIYPKSTSGAFYDLEMEDDDLYFDTTLLGSTTELASKPSKRRNKTAGKKPKRRKARDLETLHESSEAELKLQSLIATAGDSDTEADLVKSHTEVVAKVDESEKMDEKIPQEFQQDGGGGTGDAANVDDAICTENKDADKLDVQEIVAEIQSLTVEAPGNGSDLITNADASNENDTELDPNDLSETSNKIQ